MHSALTSRFRHVRRKALKKAIASVFPNFGDDLTDDQLALVAAKVKANLRELRALWMPEQDGLCGVVGGGDGSDDEGTDARQRLLRYETVAQRGMST